MYAETLVGHGAALWSSRGSRGAVVPADGCVDLILRGDEVLVAGPSTRWIATLADGDDGSLGLRLPPGRAAGVLRLDLAEIRDELLPLRDLLGRAAAEPLRTAMLDDPARRPGMRVLGELGVVSPLRELGLTKDDVRALSRELGLFTAQKPNFSCYATKVPTGEKITAARLAEVAAREAKGWR